MIRLWEYSFSFLCAVAACWMITMIPLGYCEFNACQFLVQYILSIWITFGFVFGWIGKKALVQWKEYENEEKKKEENFKATFSEDAL
jgi:hypothetical protein